MVSYWTEMQWAKLKNHVSSIISKLFKVKKNGKLFFSNLCLFKYLFIYFNITIANIYIVFALICISFFSTKLNLNPIEFEFHPMYLNSIQVACNVIQYQLFFFFFFVANFCHLMTKKKGLEKNTLFNIFIWMELISQKIKSFL